MYIYNYTDLYKFGQSRRLRARRARRRVKRSLLVRFHDVMAALPPALANLSDSRSSGECEGVGRRTPYPQASWRGRQARVVLHWRNRWFHNTGYCIRSEFWEVRRGIRSREIRPEQAVTDRRMNRCTRCNCLAARPSRESTPRSRLPKTGREGRSRGR